MSFRRYLLGRVLLFPVAIYVVVSVTFALLALIPTDIPKAMAGDFATPEQVAQVSHVLGLDQPPLVRYWQYMSGLARGDWGTSFSNRLPVRDQILSRIPATLEIVVPGLLLSTVLGISLGTLSAYYNGRPPDRVSRLLVSAIQSTPEFLLALVLLYVFFFLLRVVPAPLGQLSLSDQVPPFVTGLTVVDAALAGQWNTLASALWHLVTPVLVITLSFSATTCRLTRTTVAQALESQYVVFARACGLSEWQVLRMALLEARTPLLTHGANVLGHIIGAAAIVELIFNWQGAGQWALTATLNLDFPGVLGFVALGAATTLTAYISLDLIAAALDPRITYHAGR